MQGKYKNFRVPLYPCTQTPPRADVDWHQGPGVVLVVALTIGRKKKVLLRMKLLPLIITLAPCVCLAYTPSRPSRRDVLTSSSFAAIASFVVQPAIAFEGSGSSAYSGMNPTTKAALMKSYKSRIAADVRDFNALGAAINKGQTDGNEWVSFFIQYPRREPDAVGRTYAALADLIGTSERGGGCGYLLAASFAKPNKPPDNVPAVMKYKTLAKAFAPIQSAGSSGDAKKAQEEFQKASVLFREFLQQVEMPASLDDPLYQ